jgi:hypothetical protein
VAKRAVRRPRDSAWSVRLLPAVSIPATFGKALHLLRGIQMPDFIHSFIDDEHGRGGRLSTVECAIASAIEELPTGVTPAA